MGVLSGVEVHVDIKGLPELLSKLNSNFWVEPISDALKKTLLSVQADAIERAKPHAGDTGQLARSIKVSPLSGTLFPLTGRVFTDLAYAIPAEYGRRPGKQPPVAPIANWLRRHGGDESRAYIVARGIGRRGTKGIFYMTKAGEKVGDHAAKFLKVAAAQIESKWGR